MDEFLELVDDLSINPDFECTVRRCGGEIKFQGILVWDSEEDACGEGDLYRKVMRKVELLTNTNI